MSLLGVRSLLVLLLVASAPAAAFDIVSTSPAPYALHVPATLAEISITFDEAPLAPAAGAIRVAGTMSGPHAGTVQLVGSTLTFTVQGPWLSGELVHVNLRSDLAGPGGTLTDGHYFAFTIRSGASPASWSEPAAYHAADVPYFIYGGDVDGDGMPDVCAPNEGTDDLSVWLNQGDGSFGARSDYGVGQVPSSCFGEDFDGDGDVDIATADIASGTMTVSLNDGSGVFTGAFSYFAGVTTRQVHGGDFDGDNDIDICATSYGTDVVYLYRNEGTGAFTTLPTFGNVAPGPFAIRTGDFNLDGRLDIGVACQDADSVTVLMNQGGGTFAATGRFRTNDGPWCLNGNDMDGDGDFDLVTVASFNNRVQVLYNDGAGGFPTRWGAPTGSFPLGVFVADLDGDGDQDVTSSNFSAGTVGVYDNPGNGQIALDVTLQVDRSGSYTWAHDLDGDGDLDLSVVDELADSLFVFTNQPPTDAPVVSAPRSRPLLLVRPNPVPPAASVVLQPVDVGAAATIDVFSLAGRRIRRLHDGPVGAAGVTWNGRDESGRALPAGTYFVRARGTAGNATAVVRLVR
jgi:hypothetical protein